MFVKNTWYVAAWADELGNTPIARTILNEPVVLYRGESGNVAALENRCCHRGLPLQHGDVIADCIRCAYHGLEYNAQGLCVRVPGQDKIPSKARVKRYPVVEQDDLVWIWMGDEERADPAKVPSYPWHQNPSWRYKKNTYLIEANHLLLYDNLLDLTHLGYVHKRTIGGDAETHFAAETKVARSVEGVTVRRWMPDCVPPPAYTAKVQFNTSRVDRWQEIDFVPGMVTIYAGALDVGKGALDGIREGGFGFRGLNAMTPETEDTTHYFWSAAHNFAIDDPSTTQAVYDNIVITFSEDKEIIESQYKSIKRDRTRPLIDIGFDNAPNQARRHWDAMCKAEQEASTGDSEEFSA